MPGTPVQGKRTTGPKRPARTGSEQTKAQPGGHRQQGFAEPNLGKPVRRMTFTLPGPVAEFVIRKAEEQHTTYTDVAARIIDQVRQAEEEALLEEGYRWCAQDNAEFASATAGAFWDVIKRDPEWPDAPEASGEKG